MTGAAPRDLATATLDSLAELFVDARRTETRVAPPRSESMLDLDAAYSVQRRFAERHAAGGERTRAGFKVLANGAAAQSRLGITEPLLGTLFSDDVHRAPALAPSGVLHAPVLHAHVAFVVRRDLPELCSRELVVDSVDVAPALELADSRYDGWPERSRELSVQDVVLDNAFTGRLFLGEPRPAAEVELDDVTASVHVEQRVLAATTRAVTPPDPVGAVGWLARTVHRVGGRLTAGTLVTVGVLAGPPVGPGALRADLGRLGAVAVTLLPPSCVPDA